VSSNFYLEEKERPSEAEQVFSSTTSKKNLSGVRGRASRTGRKGAVMTPVDFLRGRAKKEYMQNSEVKVYNMYDEKVMPYEDFIELPVEKQVVLMTRWRDQIGTNNIIRDMKISRKKFYSEVLKSLGIETKPRGRRPRQEENREAEESMAAVPVESLTEKDSDITSDDTFFIVINGKFDGHSVSNRLARLARILEGERAYTIRVEVRECIKKG
jgi:hypothetical protein